MTITAKVIEDSKHAIEGTRVTTLELVYPRFIHAEVLTHRVFSRNASSSRAIPIERMLKMIEEDPAMPIHWGKNQAGMQAHEELSSEVSEEVKMDWLKAMEFAVAQSRALLDLGVHKQVANRITEPFQHIKVLVTATEWDNFFHLRDHCFSEDTEMLTEDGWKLISEVKEGDSVITLDKDTKKLTKTYVQKVVGWESKGSAIEIKGQTVDLLLSHKHKQLVFNGDDLEFIDAENLVGERPRLYKTCEVEEADINSEEYKFGRFLGFYLGNGYTVWNEEKGNYSVHVCKGGDNGESVINYYNEIIKTLFPSTSTSVMERLKVYNLQFSSKDLSKYFKDLGESSTVKRIPKECWDWSINSLEGLFQGLMDADSNKFSRCTNEGGLKYYTSSKGLADDIQRLALMTGRSASMKMNDRVGRRSRGVSPVTGVPYDITTKSVNYYLSINEKRNSPKMKYPVREVPYKGKFVCVSLKEHNTLYVRRNGKSVWSGNCDAQPEIQALAKEMKKALKASKPTILKKGEWHLPYVTKEERETLDTDLLPKLSSARCARVSYNNFDGTNANVEKDLELFDKLAGSDPIHASALEHPCKVMFGRSDYQNKPTNFKDFLQYRRIVEKQLES